jgi:hypothetical protein
LTLWSFCYGELSKKRHCGEEYHKNGCQEQTKT